MVVILSAPAPAHFLVVFAIVQQIVYQKKTGFARMQARVSNVPQQTAQTVLNVMSKSRNLCVLNETPLLVRMSLKFVKKILEDVLKY